MFLDNNYNKEYLKSLLNEAPEDNANADQTTMSNDPNATYEPQEQDASMGTENDTGDMGMDQGMEEMDMGDGSGDMGMGEAGGEADSGMSADGSTGVNTKDLFKKRKLFKDYKDLLLVMENIMEIATNTITKDLPEDAKKIYTFINHKMDENKAKMEIILTEQFFNLSYQQLLTIYMYIKMATKLYADMIKQINDLYTNEK